ncbi:permease [Acetobacteraceae bacterium ESL0709]|nr:permease [Acetobacteraceae bacterium ESL0697]MDF7678931.1 permease [Acetobacteraceae bacterium ESL0709]
MTSVPIVSNSWLRRPLPGKTPWWLLILLLCAFIGQVVVQSVSLPEETPRSVIERLTGIDIAPSPSSAGHYHHGGMMMPHNEHHHLLKNSSSLPFNGHHHHHGDESCPLCPLLGHVFFALSFAIIALGAGRFTRIRWEKPAQPRAPPALDAWQFPPSRAPPVSL